MQALAGVAVGLEEGHLVHPPQGAAVAIAQIDGGHKGEMGDVLMRDAQVLRQNVQHAGHCIGVGRGGQRVALRQQLEGAAGVPAPRVHRQVVGHLVHQYVGGS